MCFARTFLNKKTLQKLFLVKILLQHLIVVKVLFQHITVVDKHERAHEAKRQKIARMSQFMNEPKTRPDYSLTG